MTVTRIEPLAPATPHLVKIFHQYTVPAPRLGMDTDMEYVIWDMGYGIWDMGYGL